jgi:hypothetical protein
MAGLLTGMIEGYLGSANDRYDKEAEETRVAAREWRQKRDKLTDKLALLEPMRNSLVEKYGDQAADSTIRLGALYDIKPNELQDYAANIADQIKNQPARPDMNTDPAMSDVRAHVASRQPVAPEAGGILGSLQKFGESFSQDNLSMARRDNAAGASMFSNDQDRQAFLRGESAYGNVGSDNVTLPDFAAVERTQQARKDEQELGKFRQQTDITTDAVNARSDHALGNQIAYAGAVENIRQRIKSEGETAEQRQGNRVLQVAGDYADEIAAEQDPKKKIVLKNRFAQAIGADYDSVAGAISEIKTLQQSGKPAQASALATELLKRMRSIRTQKDLAGLTTGTIGLGGKYANPSTSTGQPTAAVQSDAGDEALLQNLMNAAPSLAGDLNP